MGWRETYQEWMEQDLLLEWKNELRLCTGQEDLEDRFYKELEFGTGGLRGILGCGTNRMNPYTVARATRGLAAHILQEFKDPSCAIGYDSRNKSREFAFMAAGILAEQNIQVRLFPYLAPTPMLSFAVRYYNCSCGVMITASHNPAQYNGYKVYRPDGCQITPETAKQVLSCINRENYFEKGIPDYQKYVEDGSIRYISDKAADAYEEAVKNACTGGAQSPLKVVYSPLNGTGNLPVRRMLEQIGNVELIVVSEQELPDGNFPTCPFPNPELPEAMELAARIAKRENADFFMATDPDCDKVGVGTIDKKGKVHLFTGNEIGILLLEYICRYRKEYASMPKHPIVIKTIVTTDLTYKIAEQYELKVLDVLTGFKFIGEQISYLEQHEETERFIFGFEESCGYLSGTYVRDKDAVNAAVLICEMAGDYKRRKKNLIEAMNEIYDKYGWHKSELLTYEFPGAKGMEQMNAIMDKIRAGAGIVKQNMPEVTEFVDYLKDKTGLPVSNVVQMQFGKSGRLIIRPSGTEPKIKMYIMASGETECVAECVAEELRKKCNAFVIHNNTMQRE